MQLIVLIENHFKYATNGLVKQFFGPEFIVDKETGEMLAVGKSALIEGEASEVKAWLKQIGGTVWVSDNPMLGAWYKETISNSNENTQKTSSGILALASSVVDRVRSFGKGSPRN